MLRDGLAIAMLSLLATPAAAQSTVAEGRPTVSVEQRGDQVRVQLSVNFLVPGPPNESEAALRAHERARRLIYEMAAHECRVLRETIADECRLENMNVNINRQHGPQLEGFSAGGNFTFRITLK